MKKNHSHTSGSHLSLYGALAANIGIAVVKFIASAFTGSSSMISEGVHSLVDSGNEILLLLGMRMSKKEATPEHRFGHGKEIYFWSLIVSVLIFGLGGGVSLYEGITHIMHPSELSDPTWNYVVLVIALIFESTSLVISVKTFLKGIQTKKTFLENLSDSKDPSLFVVIYEDSAAVVGLVIAALGIFLSQHFQNPAFDGAASVLIGLVLCFVAIIMITESRGLLLGESTGQIVTTEMQRFVDEGDAFSKVLLMKTMYLGPEHVLMVIRLHLEGEVTASEGIHRIKELKKQIQQRFPRIKEIYIELG